MKKDNRTISIVSPVYNNESTLVDLVKWVLKVAEKIYLFREDIFVIVNVFSYITILDYLKHILIKKYNISNIT